MDKEKKPDEGISTESLFWIDMLIGHYKRCVIEPMGHGTADEFRVKNDKAKEEVLSELIRKGVLDGREGEQIPSSG